jgi:uncharacterized membrane protein YheB (UPF0754 family)
MRDSVPIDNQQKEQALPEKGAHLEARKFVKQIIEFAEVHEKRVQEAVYAVADARESTVCRRRLQQAIPRYMANARQAIEREYQREIKTAEGQAAFSRFTNNLLGSQVILSIVLTMLQTLKINASAYMYVLDTMPGIIEAEKEEIEQQLLPHKMQYECEELIDKMMNDEWAMFNLYPSEKVSEQEWLHFHDTTFNKIRKTTKEDYQIAEKEGLKALKMARNKFLQTMEQRAVSMEQQLPEPVAGWCHKLRAMANQIYTQAKDYKERTRAGDFISTLYLQQYHKEIDKQLEEALRKVKLEKINEEQFLKIEGEFVHKLKALYGEILPSRAQVAISQRQQAVPMSLERGQGVVCK